MACIGHRDRRRAVSISRVVGVVDVGDGPQQGLVVGGCVDCPAEGNNREGSRARYIAHRVTARMNRGRVAAQQEVCSSDVEHFAVAIMKPCNHQLHLRQIGVVYIGQGRARCYGYRYVRRVRTLGPGDAVRGSCDYPVQIHHRRIIDRGDGDGSAQRVGVRSHQYRGCGRHGVLAVVDQDAVGPRGVGVVHRRVFRGAVVAQRIE